jgi:ornithine cyclodeaminase/alanine dehydrogenase-like protein (mu-crystallin family)
VGPAASSALKALRLVRSIEQVWLYEPSEADNFELAKRLGLTLSMAVHAVASPQEAVQAADIVVLTGGVPLGVAVPPPGAHVTVLAAETFSEPPLPAPLLARARRFCDVAEPALEWGASFDAELGQVLSKERDGRLDADEVTLFASVGPAFLDLLAAWHVYEGARHDEGLTRIDLEA